MTEIAKKPKRKRTKESPETIRKRVAAFRERAAQNDIVRVEIYAHKDDKPMIELYARSLTEQRTAKPCLKHGVLNCQACGATTA